MGRDLGSAKGLITRVKRVFYLESEDPLHLCISSKYYEKYKNACSLVQELLINIYEEYKRFCERNNKIPISSLNIKKLEGIYSRRDTHSPNECQANLLEDNL